MNLKEKERGKFLPWVSEYWTWQIEIVKTLTVKILKAIIEKNNLRKNVQYVNGIDSFKIWKFSIMEILYRFITWLAMVFGPSIFKVFIWPPSFCHDLALSSLWTILLNPFWPSTFTRPFWRQMIFSKKKCLVNIATTVRLKWQNRFFSFWKSFF